MSKTNNLNCGFSRMVLAEGVGTRQLGSQTQAYHIENTWGNQPKVLSILECSAWYEQVVFLHLGSYKYLLDNPFLVLTPWHAEL